MKTILEYLLSKGKNIKLNKPSKDARLCTVKEFICFYVGGLDVEDIDNCDFATYLWYDDGIDHTTAEVMDYIKKWGDEEIYIELVYSKLTHHNDIVVTGMPEEANDEYDSVMEDPSELDNAINYAKEEITKNNW